MEGGQGAAEGERLLFPLGLWGRESQRRLAWPGSVEGCQGLFSETSLVVTSQAWGKASPVSPAQADPSESWRVLRDGSSPLGDGQPQRQARQAS